MAAVVAVGVVLGVRRIGDNDRESSDPNDAYGVSHVHGLGINPADDSLIVATHNGSFRIPAGGEGAERTGDSLQDTMGFTVLGPDHFVGSGHPDLAGRRAGQPAQLGLIESTDAGATWTDVALSGQVDFHALAYANDQIYGWDSGTGNLMVSTSEPGWEIRSTLDLYGFAVDPNNPDHLIAATPNGLVDSTDGGRTWVPPRPACRRSQLGPQRWPVGGRWRWHRLPSRLVGLEANRCLAGRTPGTARHERHRVRRRPRHGRTDWHLHLVRRRRHLGTPLPGPRTVNTRRDGRTISGTFPDTYAWPVRRQSDKSLGARRKFCLGGASRDHRIADDGGLTEVPRRRQSLSDHQRTRASEATQRDRGPLKLPALR